MYNLIDCVSLQIVHEMLHLMPNVKILRTVCLKGFVVNVRSQMTSYGHGKLSSNEAPGGLLDCEMTGIFEQKIEFLEPLERFFLKVWLIFTKCWSKLRDF